MLINVNLPFMTIIAFVIYNSNAEGTLAKITP